MAKPIFDSTPMGEHKGEITSFRDVYIKEFEELGFRNRTFSHRKEAVTRRADGLWLTYQDNITNVSPKTGKYTPEQPIRVEARIHFYEDAVKIFVNVKKFQTGRNVCMREFTNPIYSRFESAYTWDPSVVISCVKAMMVPTEEEVKVFSKLPIERQ